MKKGIIKVFAIVFSVMLLCVGVVGCSEPPSPYEIAESARETIKRVSGIEIPSDTELVYRCAENQGFAPGRPTTYYIFRFEEKPTEWLINNSFDENGNDYVEDFYYYFSSFLRVVKIPQNKLPSYEKDYYCLDISMDFCFFYDLEDLLLLVCLRGY